MRRILLLLAGAAILALPAAAAARAHVRHEAPGFLVVRNASTDGGVSGNPVATLVVQGFVLGHIAQEGAVEIYDLEAGGPSAQVSGIDLSRQAVTYHTVPGTKFSGSDFKFRAVGGVWRVVVYGAGVSLYLGGTKGQIALHGSVYNPATDGVYSFDGRPFASLPRGVVTRSWGQK